MGPVRKKIVSGGGPEFAWFGEGFGEGFFKGKFRGRLFSGKTPHTVMPMSRFPQPNSAVYPERANETNKSKNEKQTHLSNLKETVLLMKGRFY